MCYLQNEVDYDKGGVMVDLNETSEQRFKRLAAQRTNQILEKLRILGNCSNQQVYKYSAEDIEKIFSVIEKRVKEVKAKFTQHGKNKEKFQL